MRARDGLLLLVGAAVGAGMAILAVPERAGVAGRSNEPVVPAPAAPPAAPDPVPLPGDPPPRLERGGPAEGPEAPGIRDLQLGAVDAELRLERLLLAAKGVPRGAGEAGFAGNPHAGRSPDQLAQAREKAALVVEPLLAKWRSATPGEERAAAMKELAVPMFRLLEAGGSMEHLVTLEEAAERGETAAERKRALIATHTLWQAPVVDFLVARARSIHIEVRFYAVEGLAWVRGDEMPRAIEGVVRGLEDEDPGVRGIAATSLGMIVADPARAEAILDRLGRETDPGAAQAMSMAVLKLDTDGGRARVSRALASVSEEVRAAAESSIAPPK